MLLTDFGVVRGRVKHILLKREHNFSRSPGTFLLFVYFAFRLGGVKGAFRLGGVNWGAGLYPQGATNNGISLSCSFSLHLPGETISISRALLEQESVWVGAVGGEEIECVCVLRERAREIVRAGARESACETRCEYHMRNQM
jgi:hypothetical protein